MKDKEYNLSTLEFLYFPVRIIIKQPLLSQHGELFVMLKEPAGDQHFCKPTVESDHVIQEN